MMMTTSESDGKKEAHPQPSGERNQETLDGSFTTIFPYF